MPLIFNNPNKPNQKRNFKRTYIFTAILLAVMITLLILFDWGMFVFIGLITILSQLLYTNETEVQIQELSLSIEKRYLFFQRQYQIPLHKLQSWRLMSKSNNRIDFYYQLKHQKTKK